MVKFTNKFTNTTMWVADERKEEYLSAGHSLADAPVEQKPEEVEEVKPKRRTTTKKK